MRRVPSQNPKPPQNKLIELANAFEPIQDGRIYIEKINEPFLYQFKGTPAEYIAGPDYAIAKGWLKLHESGTYVRLAGARRLADDIHAPIRPLCAVPRGRIELLGNIYLSSDQTSEAIVQP